MVGDAGPCRQSQTGPTPDAAAGTRGDLPTPEHEQTGSGPQNPYLLGGIAIERVNQVWCSDVTYIPMARGFLYLVVIMDWVSRAVLAWRLSNTLGADFCVDALEEALARYGRPEIFNTDQGSQFTSDDFTGTLKRHGVMISMAARAAAWTTSSSSGCGAATNTRKCSSMPVRSIAEARLGLRLAQVLQDERQHRALVTAAEANYQERCGYVDDRLRRPAALPPLPEQARKAGKCSPSPTYPQAPQPMKGLMLMK